MFRLTLLSLLLALFPSALCAGPTTTTEGGKPKLNFVFILIDDMGWMDLGCYGSSGHLTPHIDRLAASGMRFTNAYAACPVCSPTRASILTGKYPARLHLTDWLPGRTDRPSQKLLRPKIRQHLPLEEVTLAEALKPASYVSASIGKWHLGGPDYSPEMQGFDVNIGGTAAGSPRNGYFKFQSPTLKLREGEYLTDRLTDEALAFIDKNRDRPFFLYLAHYAVHIPLQAKKEVVARYQPRAKPDDPQTNPVYAAMVESVDESVGRLLKKLEELKLAERTVVIFTSDNGGLSVKEGPHTPATSNAPLRTGKGYLYEGGIREPLLVRWPGVTRAGNTCDVPISSVDYFPTVLDMAGVKQEGRPAVDGVSLVPLLRGDKMPRKDRALYWHYPHYSNQGGTPGGAVRLGEYKLIEFYEDGKLELYNLKEDIGEKNDLVRRMPEKTKELHRLLKEWRSAVKAQMPTPNPDYRSPQPN
jgi:arylsulfatase A-like enzyme